MIIAYAGRRAGSADFPAEHVAFTRQRIEQLLKGLRPRVVVGSAAAGADLIVIAAAHAAGAEVRVVLSGDRARFRAGSVADKGAEWTEVYDDLLSLERVTVEEVERSGDDADDWYRAVTARIRERAFALARDDEETVGLIVAREREHGIDHSRDLAGQLRHRGALVLRVDPAATSADCPPAFVAMPFGTKPEPARGWSGFKADASYHRVIAPALIATGHQPQRADTDALLEVIDHTMLRSISGARVMVVDLATLNPNVFWELGLRHAWRVTGTVLIAPDWTANPFDVKRAPLHRYRRDEQGVDDHAAVAAIAMLIEALEDVEQNHTSSPVFAALGSQIGEVILPAPEPGTAAETASGLLTEITSAQDVGDAEQLARLHARIRDDPLLPAATSATLIEQIGFGLIALARHDEAIAVLRPLAAADPGRRRRRLQEQYAHALIRSRDPGGAQRRLREAERVLSRLLAEGGERAETLGLLGSATKCLVEEAVAARRVPDAADVEDAIRWYERGFRCEPGNHYPGINTIALLRLSGQHWDRDERKLRRARALEPVVRFAIERRGGDADDDLWAQLTLAECALHRYLLDHDEADREAARRGYARANRLVDEQQRESARRQLELMRAAGDPAAVIDPLLEQLA